MSGPEDVAELLRAHLADAVPTRLDELRAELSLTTKVLPDPKLVTAQERDLVNLAEWPAIFVVVQRLEGLRRNDGPNEDGTVTYRARYPVRVFVFVRADGYEPTDLLRKRYVRATREVLFAGQEVAELDERSYSESYSDVGQDDNKRSIAGFYADFTVELDEDLAARPATPAPDPDGWAMTVEEATLPHPALD